MVNLIGGAKKEFDVCFGLKNTGNDNMAHVEIWPMITTYSKHGKISFVSSEVVRMPLIRNGYAESACLKFSDFKDGEKKLKRDMLKNAEFFVSVKFYANNAQVVGSKSLPIESVVYTELKVTAKK